MSKTMLQATGVSKLFGQVRALNDVELSIGPGVTGLLGPNGSGKSTLLKLFAGQLIPDAGQVQLMGEDPFRSPRALRGLGLCPEQDKFYEDLTGYAFVEALTRLHGFSKAQARERTQTAMERVGMTTNGRKQIGGMSRGMRQRTKIAQAIAHDPSVVLLDEPLTGADPVARADLIHLIKGLGDDGRCVLVSSHVLHEVQAMTHSVIFIRFGRVRAHGDIFRLRALLKDRPYRIRVSVPDPRALAAQLVHLPHIRAVGIVDDQIELTTTDIDAASRDVPAAAAALHQIVTGFTSPDADLESLYRYLMSHA